MEKQSRLGVRNMSYKVVFEYIDKKGFKVAGNCRELYLNDPKETPEAGLLTEVQVPVEG